MFDESEILKPNNVLLGNNISLVLFSLSDCIFVSQNFQETAIHTQILNAISIDHFPVLCSFQKLNQCQRGPGLWKCNDSLVCNEEYVSRLKWEVLKYEIRCFTIKFSKDLAKVKKSKQYSLENKLKLLESNLNCDINSQSILTVKNNLKKFMMILLKALK